MTFRRLFLADRWLEARCEQGGGSEKLKEDDLSK